MTHVIVLPEGSVDILDTADQSLGLLPSLNFRQVGKFLLFQLLSHHQKSSAAHCTCLTFSLVAYAQQIRYQPPPVPTSYKYVRELFICFHNLSGALQHLFL